MTRKQAVAELRATLKRAQSLVDLFDEPAEEPSTGFKLEVPIEALNSGTDTWMREEGSARVKEMSRVAIDPDYYDGAQFWLEANGYNFSGGTQGIDLITDHGATVATVAFPRTITKRIRAEQPWVPDAGRTEYLLRYPVVQGAGVTLYGFRSLVQQRGATRTRVQISLAGDYCDSHGPGDRPALSGGGPEYAVASPERTRIWRYESARYSRIKSMEFEVLGQSVGAPGVACLWNRTADSPYVELEIPTTLGLWGIPFAGLPDGEYELRVRNPRGGVIVYSPAVYITLDPLERCEVLVRLMRYADSKLSRLSLPFLWDSAAWSHPVVTHLVTGYAEGTNPVTLVTGSPGRTVEGSEILMSPGERRLYRSDPLTLENGEYHAALGGTPPNGAAVVVDSSLSIQVGAS